MKKALKVLAYVIAAIIVILFGLLGFYYFNRTSPVRAARGQMGPAADTLRVDGMAFRDLNKNGTLDPYEDRRNPVSLRVDDLLARMTLEEKAGLLFHTFVVLGRDGELASPLNPLNLLPVEAALFEKKMSFFNLFWIESIRETARWHNTVQRLAERTRLGIPVTFSSDPRHTAATQGGLAFMYTDGFSHWTEPTNPRLGPRTTGLRPPTPGSGPWTSATCPWHTNSCPQTSARCPGQQTNVRGH